MDDLSLIYGRFMVDLWMIYDALPIISMMMFIDVSLSYT